MKELFAVKQYDSTRNGFHNVTLDRVGSSRTGLIQVLIFLADLKDGSILNELWDEWVPTGQLPIRACVEAKLAPGYFVEMVISAAVIG